MSAFDPKRIFGLRIVAMKKLEVEPGRQEFMAGQFTGPAENEPAATVQE